jgi:hypothetical protein
MVGFYRAERASRPAERDGARCWRACCLTVMGMFVSCRFGPRRGAVFLRRALDFCLAAGRPFGAFGLLVDDASRAWWTDCRAVFRLAPIFEWWIHIMGLGAALAVFGFCGLPTAGRFFLFGFGLLGLLVWLFALQALALFSYWSFGVAVLAVCLQRWPFLVLPLVCLRCRFVVCLRRWPFLVFMSVYLHCPCAGRHLLFFAAVYRPET